MHNLVVDAIVASVRLRVSQGDHPTETAHDVEILESVVVALADALAASAPRKETAPPMLDRAHQVICDAVMVMNRSALSHELLTVHDGLRRFLADFADSAAPRETPETTSDTPEILAWGIWMNGTKSFQRTNAADLDEQRTIAMDAVAGLIEPDYARVVYVAATPSPRGTPK